MFRSEESGGQPVSYDFISDAMEELLSYDLAGKNHDVYEKRLTAPTPPAELAADPHCIFFYYVRIDRDGKVRVDHYLYVDGDLGDPSTWKSIAYGDVPAIVERLALNGRPSRKSKNPPKLPSSNFKDNPWNRRSYIAIFFDEANWTFHRRRDGISSIVFNPRKGAPNDSFFDAMDLEIEMPNRRTGTDKRSAVFFVNHMIGDWTGGPPGSQERSYKFDMWLTATFANTGTIGMSVNFDPDGTNLGPPLQP